MSDRVLRSSVRNGPISVSLSEDGEKVKYSTSSTSRRQRAHKDVAMQNLRNTVAQERFRHDQPKPLKNLKKRVVFSSKRHSSDDMPNGFLSPQLRRDLSPVVGILKHTTFTEDSAAAVVASTPKTPRGRPRAARSGRVSKHASFTEEAKTSPWRSASACILEALALSVSPLSRKRAQQAEEVAREEEAVRRAVSFYKGSGEWWK